MEGKVYLHNPKDVLPWKGRRASTASFGAGEEQGVLGFNYGYLKKTIFALSPT